MNRTVRVAVGSCLGLLVATFALFAATQLGVETRQTGASPGRSLFFAAWGGSILLMAIIPRARLGFSLLSGGGGLAALAAAVLAIVRAGRTAFTVEAHASVNGMLLLCGAALCTAAIAALRAKPEAGG